MANDTPKILCIGGGERVSKYQFGVAVAKAMNLPIKLIKRGKLADLKSQTKRSLEMSLDSSLYEKLSGTKLPDLAEVVRMIFRMLIVEKQSVYQIARYLAKHNYPSPEASAIVNKKRIGEIKKRNPINFWRPERVRTILQDERYIGHYYYNKAKNGQKLPASEWKLSPFVLPLIIDPYTFEQAQKLLNELKHSRPQAKDDHVYLLSGLLRCDGCYDADRDKQGRARWSGDRKEIQKGSGRFTYFYKCGRKLDGKSGVLCNVIPLPAKNVEDYIIEQAKNLLANPIAAYNHQLKLKSSP